MFLLLKVWCVTDLAAYASSSRSMYHVSFRLALQFSSWQGAVPFSWRADLFRVPYDCIAC
jgi:hypothetical protein